MGPQTLERHFMAIALDSITLYIGELELHQPLGPVQGADVFLGCHSPLVCNQCFLQQEGPLARSRIKVEKSRSIFPSVGKTESVWLPPPDVWVTKISSAPTALRLDPINCTPITLSGPACTESHCVIHCFGTLPALCTFSI